MKSIVKTVKYTESKSENWAELCKIYPFFTDEHKVAEWISQVGDAAKSSLIPHVKQQIANHIEAQERAKKSGQSNEPEVQGVGIVGPILNFGALVFDPNQPNDKICNPNCIVGY